jgi:hypothetical protein
LVTLSSGSDASLGNSPSRAGEADREADSLRTDRRKNDLPVKGKKLKVDGSKSVQDQTAGRANEYAAILVNVLKIIFVRMSYNYCFIVKLKYKHLGTSRGSCRGRYGRQTYWKLCKTL